MSKASTVSLSGATAPPAASLTDSAGTVWTLLNGRVMKNGTGVSTGSADALVLMLYFNGEIYAQNSSGGWYQERQSVDHDRHDRPARNTAAAEHALFYGMNGHMAWGRASTRR